MAFNAAHDSRYKLTQQDDCEQAETLREVSGVGRSFHTVLHGEPGSQKVHGQGQRPNPVALGNVEQSGDNPEHGGSSEADRIAGCECPRLRHPPGADILQYQHETHPRVGCPKSGRRAAIQCFLGIGCHDRGDKALQQDQDTLDQVVCQCRDKTPAILPVLTTAATTGFAVEAHDYADQPVPTSTTVASECRIPNRASVQNKQLSSRAFSLGMSSGG